MVMGCDISTKAIDLVLLNEDEPTEATHHRVVLSSPWWEAARTMEETLEDHLGSHYGSVLADVGLAGVERPYGPNRQAIASLHTILGAFLASLPSWITPVEVRPADMRHELAMKGNAAKSEMHFAIGQRFAEHGMANVARDWPPDALDAWAAAYAALQMCERAVDAA